MYALSNVQQAAEIRLELGIAHIKNVARTNPPGKHKKNLSCQLTFTMRFRDRTLITGL
jgi:hypothetical protein